VAAVEGPPNALGMGPAKEGGDGAAGSARPEPSGTDCSSPPAWAGWARTRMGRAPAHEVSRAGISGPGGRRPRGLPGVPPGAGSNGEGVPNNTRNVTNVATSPIPL